MPEEAVIGVDRVTTGTLFFDVGDLLHYFRDNRLPTGIQRVSIATVSAMLDEPLAERIRLCCYVEEQGGWIEVPAGKFVALCGLSVADEVAAEIWNDAFGLMWASLSQRRPLFLPPNSTLVSLGTSWWLPDYFMHVRQLKRDFGVKLAILVHDLIPVVATHYCGTEHVQDFIDWLVGVLQHADILLTVSTATRDDLVASAATWGLPIPSERILPLPLATELPKGAGGLARRPESVLRRLRLIPGGYVLFVATLEARKNQVGALGAWQHLLSTMDRRLVPKLVLVGKEGFGFDHIRRRLDASSDLAAHVVIASAVSDPELDELYRECLFTIYPSHYEGWGLPVTESLVNGKVPVIADNSSLPEASQGCGLTFRSGSETDLARAVELLLSPAERLKREQKIRQSFRTRRWSDVARDLHAFIDASTHDEAPVFHAPTLAPGYFPLHRNRETAIGSHVGSAEIVRAGGWWRIEDFGSWTRSGGGRLSIILAEGCTRLFLELVGLPQCLTSYVIDIGARQVSGRLSPGQKKWVTLDVEVGDCEKELSIRIASRETSIVVEPASGHARTIGVGLSALFVMDHSLSRLDFIEAVALGMLEDYKVHPSRINLRGDGPVSASEKPVGVPEVAVPSSA